VKVNLTHFVRQFEDPAKRSAWQAIGLAVALLAAFGVLLWYWSLSRPPVVVNPDEILLETVLIGVKDLPDAWYSQRIVTEEPYVRDGIGKDIWFYRSRNRPWVNISADVHVYHNEDAAKRGYQRQLDKYAHFGLQGWDAMPQIAFSHHADEMHPSCVENNINRTHNFACEVVGRYGRVVIVVGGNIYDKRWLTAEQFRQVLMTADQKADQSRIEQ
jgi:hypothetical protein